MDRSNIPLAALAAACLVLAPPAAGVEVASVFGSKMVLQRDVPVPVWGKAEPGEKITVTFAGQSRSAVADRAGRWSVTMGRMPASDRPRALTVKGASGTVTFENVLVGEVWLVLCAGPVGKQYTTEGPVPSVNTRVLALDGGRSNHSPAPQESYGRSSPWGPDRRQAFDVVSIPFANRLNEVLGVPVGMIRVRVGDLEATTPREGFAAVPSLREIAARVETWSPATPRGRKAFMQWLRDMKRWRQALDRKLAGGGAVEPTQPPRVPGPLPDDPAQPTVVYNRQLHPLVPFAVRGALHLHAEGHTGDPRCTTDPRYADKMRALIAGLRAVFRRADLAFAFSQRGVPSIYHKHTLGEELRFNAWAGHRDRQRAVLPHARTGMVVTLDVENHPGLVAERFARWALAEAYGKGGASSGPIYRRRRVQGGRVVLEFDHAEGGLMVAGIPAVGRPPVERTNAPLRFFALAGEDRIFHRAQARIEGNTVVVRSNKVPRPVAVRYACRFDPRGMNLYSRAGLPACPFRTDDWPIGELEAEVERRKTDRPEALVAMLGYPAELHAHAAASALAAKGEATALPLIERLAESSDPDRRCGAVRALGYLYWMGPVPRNYYNAEPQTITPAVSRAIDRIARAAEGPDPLLRRAAAEALSLIGAESEGVFRVVQKLAVDDDALVRTAAARLSKYRFNSHAHNTGIAYAILKDRPFGDRTSAALAGNLLNHYRLKGPIDMTVVSRFLSQLGPGQGGGAVSSLGDMLRRVKTAEGLPSLNDPRVLPAVLHLYALGYRNYMLYGVERWITRTENVPAFRGKVRELTSEIGRLRRSRPAGWTDRSRRYADAIAGLEDLIEQSQRPRK